MALEYYSEGTTNGSLPYPMDLFTEEVPSMDQYQKANTLYWIAKCVFDTPTDRYSIEVRKTYRNQFTLLCNGLDGEKGSVWFQLLVREMLEVYGVEEEDFARNAVLDSFCSKAFDEPIPVRKEWRTISIY